MPKIHLCICLAFIINGLKRPTLQTNNQWVTTPEVNIPAGVMGDSLMWPIRGRARWTGYGFCPALPWTWYIILGGSVLNRVYVSPKQDKVARLSSLKMFCPKQGRKKERCPTQGRYFRFFFVLNSVRFHALSGTPIPKNWSSSPPPPGGGREEPAFTAMTWQRNLYLT